MSTGEGQLHEPPSAEDQKGDHQERGRRDHPDAEYVLNPVAEDR